MTTRTVDPFEADIRKHPCPNCEAGVDQPCESRSGRTRTEAHRGRERVWQTHRARAIANGTAKPLVDWNSPTWGRNSVHVSTNGDLAGEEHSDG